MWDNWIQISKEDIDKKRKIEKYLNVFQPDQIDLNRLRDLMEDSHLADFYLKRFKSTLNRLDNYFRLYNAKLSAKNSTHILNLKSDISGLISNLESCEIMNFAIKNFYVKSDNNQANIFKENINKTFYTLRELIKAV